MRWAEAVDWKLVDTKHRLGESCFRPHPYDHSNRIDTARRCRRCHLLVFFTKLLGKSIKPPYVIHIVYRHITMLLFFHQNCWGDMAIWRTTSIVFLLQPWHPNCLGKAEIHLGKYICLTPPFDSNHLISEAPRSSHIILPPPPPSLKNEDSSKLLQIKLREHSVHSQRTLSAFSD